MAKAKRTRTVVRSAKTGRFVKRTAAKFNPSVAVADRVEVAEHSVDLARSAKTGRFVKQSYAVRNPSTTVVETIKRGSQRSRKG
jgi:signal recognition particle subunit SEC65